MNYIFTIFLFAGILFSVNAQSIERKIVIQNDRFYYTTIDAEFQMATLHTGKFSEALKTNKNLALPAGRNYDSPINPFSWDVTDSNFYAVNFLVHPLNDRNEALKRFPISSLQEWSDKVTIMDMLMKSVDQNMFAYNDPYMSVIKRSSTLNNFFYDAVAMNDSSYYMAVANNGEFCIWNYNGIAWSHSEIQQITIDAPFSLLAFNKKLYLILNSGLIYETSLKTTTTLSDKKITESLENIVLIENRDDNSISFMKNNQLDQITALNKLVKKKAVKIF